jgi:putative oligomerization/nucleic acid binding protein/uncharacterized protein DUF4429
MPVMTTLAKLRRLPAGERLVTGIAALTAGGALAAFTVPRRGDEAYWAVALAISVVVLLLELRRANRIAALSPPTTATARVHAHADARMADAASTAADVPVVRAVGANGSLELYADRIRLTKSGARALIGIGYGAGTKDIALSQVTAIQWRDAGSVVLGYVAFSFMGGADPTGGVFDSARSENAVTFTADQQSAFEHARAVVQARIGQSVTGPSLSAPSAAQAIRDLAQLRDSELITPAEYEAKRAELLERM